MIYGKPTVNVVHDVTDRVGLRTLILGQLWAPTRWPMPIAEMDGETPGVPGAPAGMQLYGAQNVPVRGGLRRLWVYTGVGSAVSFKGRGNSIDFGFRPGFAQVPIALHARIAELMAKFGGYQIDGRVEFPPTLTAATADRTQSGQTTTNPMFGHSDFLRMEGTYYYRYMATDVAGVGSNDGKIITTGALPGRVGKAYPGRNWLGAPTEWMCHGVIFEIVETYWLSGDGGWPVPIYGKSTTRPVSAPDAANNNGFGDS